MTSKRPIHHLLILIGFFLTSAYSLAQERPLGLEVDNWADKFSKNQRNEINSSGRLMNLLMETDTSRALRFLDSLESSKYAKGYYFQMFFCMLKGDYLYAKFAGFDKYKDRASKDLLRIKKQLEELYAEALDAAYHIEDNLLTGWVNFYSARRMKHFGETSWAVMYSKNGVDLFEKENYPLEPPVYTDLAELLYQVREYEESINYAKKGLLAWKTNDYENAYKEPYKFKIRALTTIGNTFYDKQRYDSANLYFQQALELAKEYKDTGLTGKCLGNIGRIRYVERRFDIAYRLFKIDYQNSKKDSLYNNAANAITWAAKANLAQGKTPAALAEAREAVQLLQLWPNGPYLRDTYQTLTQIFRSLKAWDSAFYYNDRYTTLHDSLEKEVATSSLTISKARLNDKMSRYNIEKLNREKQAVELWRNIILVSIVFVSIIVLLIINGQRLKEKMRKEKAENEKRRIEQEVASAKEQIQLITGNIIEKTNLIGKLEEQIKNSEATADQQAVLTELTQQTILTEDDWIKFKLLFEKAYPSFFTTLSQAFPGITQAEQRMAALVRLPLTTRQMASMLGISADSVHKTRQRLRQRLQLATDTSLEDTIAAF